MAAFLFSCDNWGEDGMSRFCESEKQLIQTFSADTAIWDLTLSMNSFYKDIQEQTGIDSCDSAQNIYLQIELPEFGKTFIPAKVENPYCRCCPDLPPAKIRKVIISILGNDLILFNGNPLNKKLLREQLVYETNSLFRGNKYAIYHLEWEDDAVANEKTAVVYTILTSYFKSLEHSYAVAKQGICKLESVTEMPRIILLIQKSRVPPPPPPFPDSTEVEECMKLENPK